VIFNGLFRPMESNLSLRAQKRIQKELEKFGSGDYDKFNILMR